MNRLFFSIHFLNEETLMQKEQRSDYIKKNIISQRIESHPVHKFLSNFPKKTKRFASFLP